MRSRPARTFLSVASMLVAVSLAGTLAAAEAPTAPELPALPASAWLNSKPLKLAELRGRPVLVEFWTFDCSNCRNTLAWLKDIHARYGARGLTIVAVHTPEFPHERNRDNVTRAVMQLGIRYPVMIDDEFRYWRALDNQYWPAFYLIDGEGRIVATRIGELHRGQSHAESLEREIAKRLPQG